MTESCWQIFCHFAVSHKFAPCRKLGEYYDGFPSKEVPVCYLGCIGWNLANMLVACVLRNQKVRTVVQGPCLSPLQCVLQHVSKQTQSGRLTVYPPRLQLGVCLPVVALFLPSVLPWHSDWFSASGFNFLFLFLLPRSRCNHWFILHHSWRLPWVPFGNVWWSSKLVHILLSKSSIFVLLTHERT